MRDSRKNWKFTRSNVNMGVDTVNCLTPFHELLSTSRDHLDHGDFDPRNHNGVQIPNPCPRERARNNRDGHDISNVVWHTYHKMLQVRFRCPETHKPCQTTANAFSFHVRTWRSHSQNRLVRPRKADMKLFRCGLLPVEYFLLTIHVSNSTVAQSPVP